MAINSSGKTEYLFSLFLRGAYIHVYIRLPLGSLRPTCMIVTRYVDLHYTNKILNNFEEVNSNQRKMLSKVDEKAMVRNRHNRIPHSSRDTTRERNTDNQDCIKKTQHKRKAKRSALSQ